MIIKQAVFVTSAARAEQFIRPQKPMIAVCGRSNVGKSSLINMLANQRKLARTSSSPGRTRLVNYFDFGEFMLADLPGYGYAAVSKAEKERWGRTLDSFFKEGKNIDHVLILVDIRHGATEDDMQLLHLLNYYILPFTVVLTKADKLSRMKAKENARLIANSMGLTEANTVITSAEKRTGREELLERIEQAIAVADSAEKNMPEGIEEQEDD